MTKPDIWDMPDTTLNARTMRVLHNMAMKAWQLADDHSAPPERRMKSLRSYARAMEYATSPGVRIWPDDGNEDCVSLSGELYGMAFGIIFHRSDDTWSVHT